MKHPGDHSYRPESFKDRPPLKTQRFSISAGIRSVRFLLSESVKPCIKEGPERFRKKRKFFLISLLHLPAAILYHSEAVSQTAPAADH